METMRTLSKKHGLACLLHEKPFAGINGSGKHNNYSLCTDTGENLLRPGKNPESNLLFLLMLCAFIRGVDLYADLLRMSAACAGNDHRLGGGEAPPPIISIFLGNHLTAILNHIAQGSDPAKVKPEEMKPTATAPRRLPLPEISLSSEWSDPPSRWHIRRWCSTPF